MARTTDKITLSEEQRRQLEAFAGSRSLPHAQVVRAKIILMAADGHSNIEIAEMLHLNRATVGKWRLRFLESGIGGLYDQLRPGRPRAIKEERVAELINRTLQTKPKGATHWSCRTMAGEIGISKSTVQRVWNTFGVQPHRQKHFKLSTDPFFVEKLVDIVGLYLNPPESAMVLCVDEKSQYGTTTLFAALDIANGQVMHRCRARHRHQEFLGFLRHIDESVPAEPEVHIVLDNYATHKHPKVKAWLAAHPRFHFHFVPTYSSWLNQVERWFAIITERAIRRGSFTSVKQLIEKIDTFVNAYNEASEPFTWVATAESILEKTARLCERISGTEH